MSGLITGIVSLGITATTTGISMSQQNKAKNAQGKAETAAREAMAKARKRLDVNYQEASSINKDPYTMAIEASLQQGANATQAAKETQRGAAQVGRIQGAQNQMLEAERVAYGKELQAREQRILDEDSRLRDINTQLDMGEIEGAQMAAAAEADNAAMAGQDVVAGLSSMAQQGVAMAPLYAGKGYKAKQAAFNQTDFAKTAANTAAQQAAVDRANAGGDPLRRMTNVTPDPFAGVGGMNRGDFRRFQKNNPTLWGQVTADKQYQQALFPENPALEYLRTLEQD
jgi:hypothetical protein|tara:strand:- start:139 stop:990 length:852 start_codon:yes stop_codon:yes gene_type:complete